MADIQWFVNGNFKVRAESEVEAITILFDALNMANIVRVPSAGEPMPAISGFHLTHATEEGEGG